MQVPAPCRISDRAPVCSPRLPGTSDRCIACRGSRNGRFHRLGGTGLHVAFGVGTKLREASLTAKVIGLPAMGELSRGTGRLHRHPADGIDLSLGGGRSRPRVEHRKRLFPGRHQRGRRGRRREVAFRISRELGGATLAAEIVGGAAMAMGGGGGSRLDRHAAHRIARSRRRGLGRGCLHHRQRAGFGRSRLGLDLDRPEIAIRGRAEPVQAMRAAKVIGRTLVLKPPGCLRRIHRHAADGIDRHSSLR